MRQFRTLPPARQRLIKLMQQLNFGMLRNLRIHNGQPDLGPTLEVIEDLKLDGQKGPLPEQVLDDCHIFAESTGIALDRAPEQGNCDHQKGERT